MQIHDLITQLGQFQALNPHQAENLKGLIEISKKFSGEADIPYFEPSPISLKTVVLESGHQPNFFPYSGVWKKAFLLDYIKKRLDASGAHAVAVFGFADQNLSTAQYLFRNQIPAFNKQGSENIGFKITDKDRWRCFHTVAKPSDDRMQSEIEKIRRFYQGYAKNLNMKGDMIEYRTDQLVNLIQRSYDRARSFSEMNAYVFAGICSEFFHLHVLFFRYTDLQRNGIFMDVSSQIIRNLDRYNTLYNAAVSDNQGIIPRVELGDFPFWYHCECGGKVHLITGASSDFSGQCPVCKKEIHISTGTLSNDFNTLYPQMSPNAVARNILFSEGLGTTLFISGVGGGLRYGQIADTISRLMHFHRPLTLAWQSKDLYLGLVHQVALRDMLRTFRLTKEDLANPAISGVIREFRSALRQEVRQIRENGGDRKEIQKLEGRFLNTAVQAATVRKIFSTTPSIFDLLIACETKQILERWNVSLSEAEVTCEDHLLRMTGDVQYPCGSVIPINPDSIFAIYHAMESIEVE